MDPFQWILNKLESGQNNSVVFEWWLHQFSGRWVMTTADTNIDSGESGHHLSVSSLLHNLTLISWCLWRHLKNTRIRNTWLSIYCWIARFWELYCMEVFNPDTIFSYKQWKTSYNGSMSPYKNNGPTNIVPNIVSKVTIIKEIPQKNCNSICSLYLRSF